MKKKIKLSLLIVVGILVCVVILREVGCVDLCLYTSRISTSHSASKGESHSGNEKNFSYDLTIKYKDQTLQHFSHSYNSLPPIQIEAVMAEPTYSGNYYLPLVKNFTMKYQCQFETKKASDGRKVSGKIEGEVKATIRGLCSLVKAKELALKEANEQIASYFKNQLSQ